MAWEYDEVNDYTTLADNAVLTFPDSDWTIAGWVKLTDNTGSLVQYFTSWGLSAGSQSFNMYFREDGVSQPDEINLRINNSLNLLTTTSPGASTEWQHIRVTRSGSATTIYINNVSGASGGASYGAVNVTGEFHFGAYVDLSSTRFYGGGLAEWAKWDRALSDAEGAGLALGFTPDNYPQDLKWYIPMIREYQEMREGLAVTNNGSIVVPHLPIIEPVSVYGGFGGAAVAGAVIKTVNLDALFKKALSTGVSFDSFLLKSIPIALSIDGLLKLSDQTEESSIDALLVSLGIQTSVSLDAVLGVGGTFTKLQSLDALIKKLDLLATISLDSILFAEDSRQALLDALLNKTNTQEVIIDSILKKVSFNAISLDATFYKGYTTSTAMNSILYNVINRTSALDSLLAKGNLTDVTLMDAMLYVTLTTARSRYTFNTTERDYTFNTTERDYTFNTTERDYTFKVNIN